MPARKARPRARSRSLEGLERLLVASRCAAGPTAGDDLARFAWGWAQIRDDVLANTTPDRLDRHWAYQVLERGETPDVDVTWLGTEPETDAGRAARILQLTADQQALADGARRAWARLTEDQDDASG